MKYLLGLDIGTSGAKALLIDADGKFTAGKMEEYPTATPKPLWSEQDPEDWWSASKRCFQSLLREAGIKASEITGIGLTGQMHGLVLLDRNGSVLRPCIMWNDQRTGAQCEAMTKKAGFENLLRLTGNPVLPGFTLPKVLWVREHEPEIFKRVAHVLLPKDYIRYRLTGDFATDVSDASGTSLLDVENRRWSAEMLRSAGIPEAWMPKVYESFEIAGTVDDRSAAQTGLYKGTPVIAGGGDQAAGAVGNGIVKPGVVSITIGTSGVVFAYSESFMIEPRGRLHAFCHAVPSAWHLMGVTLAAGGSLRWFRDALGEPERTEARRLGIDPYEVLIRESSKVRAGAEGLLFLPYLSGERTPHPDPYARGVFLGLTVRHSKAHMIRAVLEGVAFSLRDCLELMKGIGVPVSEIRASGGGARSKLWRQILSDVLDAELVTVMSTEGAAYGAALLAGVGARIFSSVPAACEKTIRVASGTQPDRSHAKVYDELYAIYRSTYPALRESFASIAGVAELETSE